MLLTLAPDALGTVFEFLAFADVLAARRACGGLCRALSVPRRGALGSVSRAVAADPLCLLRVLGRACGPARCPRDEWEAELLAGLTLEFVRAHARRVMRAICEGCARGYSTPARRIWALGLEPREASQSFSLWRGDNQHLSVLVSACASGCTAIMEWALSLGPPSHDDVCAGFLAACARGSLDVARWVWSRGLPVARPLLGGIGDAASNLAALGLARACVSGHAEVARWIMGVGGAVAQQAAFTGGHYFARYLGRGPPERIDALRALDLELVWYFRISGLTPADLREAGVMRTSSAARVLAELERACDARALAAASALGAAGAGE